MPGGPILPTGDKTKMFTFVCAAMVLAASGSAFAEHHMKGEKKHGMKDLDTNSDGMISKEEFVKHHEMMYEKMKKNSKGMVDIKDMEAMHKEMASTHKGMAHDAMKK
jgi:hypothetical protein